MYLVFSSGKHVYAAKNGCARSSHRIRETGGGQQVWRHCCERVARHGDEETAVRQRQTVGKPGWSHGDRRNPCCSSGGGDARQAAHMEKLSQPVTCGAML